MKTEDLIRIYLTIRDVYETVPGSDKDFVRAVSINTPIDLKDEFDRSPNGYITDYFFYRFTGNPCSLFSQNWQGEQVAVQQMLSAGMGPIDARRIAIDAPFDSEAMTREQKIVVQSLIEGLTLREEKPGEKTREQKRIRSDDADLSVSEVAKSLRISRTTVVGLISSGRLKGFSAAAPGAKRNSWRITQQSLEEFRNEKSETKAETRTPVRRRIRLPPVKKYV